MSSPQTKDVTKSMADWESNAQLVRSSSEDGLNTPPYLDDGGEPPQVTNPPGLLIPSGSRQSLTDALDGLPTTDRPRNSRPTSERGMSARNKVEFMLASTQVIAPRNGVFPPGNFGAVEAQRRGVTQTAKVIDDESESVASSGHSSLSGASSFGSGATGNSSKLNSRAARAMGGKRLSRLVLRIPVLWRAIIIISVPILALIVLTGLSVSESAGQLNQALEDARMMEFIHALGDVIHELQVERSRTSLWVTCVELDSKDFPACLELEISLREERGLVNTKRDTFIDVTYSYRHPVTDSEFFQASLRRLQGIDQHRSLVDSSTIDYSSIVKWYDDTIRGFYDTERTTYRYIQDIDILVLHVPYLQLQDAAEVAGQLRWVGSKLAVTGRHETIVDQEHFFFLIEQLDTILQQMERSAPPSVVELWLSSQFDDTEYRALIKTFLEYTTTTTLPSNEALSNAWYDSVTAKVDAIDSILSRILSDMEAISHIHKRDQQRRLATTVVLVIFFLVICSGLTFVLALSVNATTKVLKDEVKKRRKMTSAIQRFFPSEFMSMLGKGAVTDIEDGMSTQVNVTVMFMDIRNFTSICEGFDLEQSFNLLHSYAKFVSPIITSNRGFIDKMMGDGIMAVFETAPDAIRAAVKVQYELSCINNETSSLLQSGTQAVRPFLKVGIGIHTGDVILGTLGDSRRIDGTIVGDAVNVASRLEGLTKFFGVNILVSKEVLNAAQVAEDMEQLSYRQLGHVRVKGKNNALEIFDVYHADDITMKQFKESTKAQFEDACQLYSDGQFEKAQDLLNTLEKNFPTLRDQGVERRMFLAEEQLNRYTGEGEGKEEQPVWDGIDNFNPNIAGTANVGQL